MDINNNQQVNTFIKGMDTDTSDMYMGEGSYRYAENLRVVTDGDSNSGELHIINGTTRVSVEPAIEGKLLGFTSIRQYAVAIVKHEDDTWSIYRLEFNENTNTASAFAVAEHITERIWPEDWDGKTKPLSLVTRWEADNNIKLYIADGIHSLMPINIAQHYDGTFEDIFQASTKMLLPIIVTVTESQGAIIPGVVMQYAYIIYKLRGNASTLSVLSKAAVSGVDEVTGYKVDENSTRIIKLQLPEDSVGKYVRIYRIAYSRSGQLPRVDIIYDQFCQQTEINDIGQSVENVSTAEFIAQNKLSFVPKSIESKGDYLFAANLLYNQDAIDEQFKDFDARCFSAGNYYIENGQQYDITEDFTNEQLAQVPYDNIGNKQFDAAGVEYRPQYWLRGQDGFNGRGQCFKWKYSYSMDILSDTEQYPLLKDTPRTYARNEVYRFGVRLYDQEGRASSVKWIADIKMPDYFNPGGDDSMQPYLVSQMGQRCANNLSIQFTPVDNPAWNNIYKYEIVQAKRGISDSYKIMQGISGYPQTAGKDDSDKLCVPYFLTTQNFDVGRGIADNIPLTNTLWFAGFWNATEWTYLHDNPYGVYKQNKNQLLFMSPEYTYQPDDIKSLLKQYKTSVFHHTIALYEHLDKCVQDSVDTFNAADAFYNGENTKNPLYILKSDPLKNHDGHTDLNIGVYPGSAGRPSGTYYLTQQIMASQNYTGRDNNGDNPIENEPLGGWKGAARKCAFFTNIIPMGVKYFPEKNDLSIKDITCYDASSPEDFAKDERCKIRDKFSALKNGKKFYNWTNPALLDGGIYWLFSESASDADLLDAWKEITMTAYDDAYLDAPYQWVTIHGDDTWEDYRAIAGAQVLTFPTSPGGSGIILETGESTSEYFPETFAFAKTNEYTMPPVTVANICKSATPYGGYNISAINATSYVGEGYVASPGEAITVSMGDNHITMFSYMLYHNFDNAQHDSVTSAATQYIVPIESTMDLSKTCSDYIQITHADELPVPGDGVWVQTKPSTNAGRFTQSTDMYLYNTAYSVNPDIVTLAAEDTVNASSSLCDSRIHYSQQKQNNERIDNWTSFKAIDYLDVDSRYGEITGLKLFKDKLIFLQENGAGVLSVNDRIILKDQSSANIIVGNGGVLDRYDYFTTIYGMKPNQRAVEASNDSLYWWDGYRKEIISYTDGYNVTLLQRVKNLSNYIHNGEESTTPSIIYDTDNKEVLFNVVNNESLVYNERTQQFTSVYTFSPIYYCELNGRPLITRQWKQFNELYKYDSDNNGKVYLFGEQAKPKIQYVVNKDSVYNKVFDIQTFGGRFYKGDKSQLKFDYKTPLKQHSHTDGNSVTDIEYDFRLAIPRNNDDIYGGRMRGKTMQCQIESDSNDIDFSLQYVTTKYRMSWS